MRHNAQLRPSCLARGTSSHNKPSSESDPDTMYVVRLYPCGLLTMPICGEYYSLPKRRVSRFSEVAANSTVYVWPCTLITNPTVGKHRPYRNGSRFSAICSLPPYQGRHLPCVSFPLTTSLIFIFISALQTWLDQTLMAPCSSIHMGCCVSYIRARTLLFSRRRGLALHVNVPHGW